MATDVHNAHRQPAWVQFRIRSMRIKPAEVVAGFAAGEITELLRQSADCLSARHATKILEIKTEQAIQLLARLEKGGLPEKDPALSNSDDEQSWKRTVIKGACS